MKPLPCPFCGKNPRVFPTNPEREGNAWAAVECHNGRCPTHDRAGGYGVRVTDGTLQSDERGSDAYKQAAIARWNKRAPR